MMQNKLLRYFRKKVDVAHEAALVVCAEGVDPDDAARRALCEAEQMAENVLVLTHADNWLWRQSKQSGSSVGHVAVKRLKDVVRMELPDGNHFVALCAKVRISPSAADNFQNLLQPGYGQNIQCTFRRMAEYGGKDEAAHAPVMPSAMNRYLQELKKRNEERVFQKLLELNRKVLPAALDPELYATGWGG
ncbi:MAG: hypothetical protein ACI3YD_07230 [Alloprevotella sp.]